MARELSAPRSCLVYWEPSLLNHNRRLSKDGQKLLNKGKFQDGGSITLFSFSFPNPVNLSHRVRRIWDPVVFSLTDF